MNYQHSYHCGNFADIIKHNILIFCLEKLHEKPTSFLAIDTHAGDGKYDIFSEKLLKTNEFNEGLKKILTRDFLKILPIKYLEILAKINVCSIDDLPQKIKYYPGSPLIIKNFLRYHDKAIFAETQNDIFINLRKNFAGNKKILCTKENGFDLLKSKLPPLEKRAIILIDPAYEKNHNKISRDYELALQALQEGFKRCNYGIFLLWYPIIKGDEKLLNNFYKQISKLKFDKSHHLIFDIGENHEKPHKMHSCGLFIFNMPWQVDEKINLFLPKLLQNLQNNSTANFSLKALS